jgi:hypothetical protein
VGKKCGVLFDDKLITERAVMWQNILNCFELIARTCRFLSIKHMIAMPPKVTVEWLAILLHIREVSVSNLGPEAD